MSKTTALLREYAAAEIENYGDNETPAGILTAIIEAQTVEELENLGRALLCRIEALTDPGYRYGDDNYDSRLKVIAAGLDWQA